jgi:hypothetical protein
MNWIILILSMILALTKTPSASAAPSLQQCPDKIATQQIVSKPVEDWTPTQSQSMHYLKNIDFYQGSVEERAQLKPQSTVNKARAQIVTWIFYRPPATVNLVCSYAGTSILLSQSLPDAVTQCRVTYNLRTDTGPPISVACK